MSATIDHPIDPATVSAATPKFARTKAVLKSTFKTVVVPVIIGTVAAIAVSPKSFKIEAYDENTTNQ